MNLVNIRLVSFSTGNFHNKMLDQYSIHINTLINLNTPLIYCTRAWDAHRASIIVIKLHNHFCFQPL